MVNWQYEVGSVVLGCRLKMQAKGALRASLGCRRKFVFALKKLQIQMSFVYNWEVTLLFTILSISKHTSPNCFKSSCILAIYTEE